MYAPVSYQASKESSEQEFRQNSNLMSSDVFTCLGLFVDLISPEIRGQLKIKHGCIHTLINSAVYLKFLLQQLLPSWNRMVQFRGQIRAFERGKTGNFSPSYMFSG